MSDTIIQHNIKIMAGEYCPYSQNCTYQRCEIYTTTTEEAKLNGYKTPESILNASARRDTGRFWSPTDLSVLLRSRIDLANRVRCAKRKSMGGRLKSLVRQKKDRGELVKPKPKEQQRVLSPPKTRVRDIRREKLMELARVRLMRESRRY